MPEYGRIMPEQIVLIRVVYTPEHAWAKSHKVFIMSGSKYSGFEIWQGYEYEKATKGSEYA